MTLQGRYALPTAGPHLPGRTQRPEGGPVAAAAEAARRSFEPARWQDSEAFLYGFELLAGGFFWEAHEVWEPAWMRCLPNSRERSLLQGLIQAANAGLKARMERPEATRRLLRAAAGHLAEAGGAAPGPLLGIEPATAAEALGRLAAEEGSRLARDLAASPVLQPKCSIMPDKRRGRDADK